jgi:low affinity Fe/Cu permease
MGPRRVCFVRRDWMNRLFSNAAQWIARQSGRAHTFVGASVVIIIWACTGPIFGYSDTWQLIINTGTTIVTFLMVFLIQNTQNRDTQAIQLKLDELIRCNEQARNRLFTLEDLTEDELDRVKTHFEKLAKIAPAEARTGRNIKSATSKSGNAGRLG